MSKTIDLDRVESWDKEEAAFNAKYLHDRGRFDEANAIADAHGLDRVAVARGDFVQIETAVQPTSARGSNDTPEAVGQTPDPVGGVSKKVGPHGRNADQFKTSESGDDGLEEGPSDAEKAVKGNIDEALAWVGDDPDRAEQALAAERAGKNRETLVEELESRVE